MRLAFLKAHCRLLSTCQLSSFRIRRCFYELRNPCNPASYGRTSPWLLCQRRGARSKATLSLQDLPKTSVEDSLTIHQEETDSPVYPTVIQQAWNNMRKFEGCVLLTRMGGFYEVSQLLVEPIASIHAVLVVLRTRRRIWTVIESQGRSKENDCRTSCYGRLAIYSVLPLPTDM